MVETPRTIVVATTWCWARLASIAIGVARIDDRRYRPPSLPQSTQGNSYYTSMLHRIPYRAYAMLQNLPCFHGSMLHRTSMLQNLITRNYP